MLTFLPQSISVLRSKQPHNPMKTAVATPSPAFSALLVEAGRKQASTLQKREQDARIVKTRAFCSAASHE